MIQFITGTSGTGKTTYIYNKISELVAEGKENIIMLVPDQSSFETEKAFLNILGAKRARQVSVFGFSKLCRYVFEKTGNIPKNVIDNGTRSVIMNLALEQLTEKLTLFKSRKSKNISEIMLQTLTECKKNSISTEMLRASANRIEDSTLKTKLIETALILDTFDALVSQSYIDPLDDLTRLAFILNENEIFKDYVLYIDSFSGFTAQQYKVLRILFNQCSEVYISLTIDALAKSNEDVFAAAYRTVRIVTELANRDCIDIKKAVELSGNYRCHNEELKLLESGIFRNDYEKSEKVPENIMLYSAVDAYNECEFVARKIKELVINEGYQYSDISVISHDTDKYNGVLNVIFDKYEIPYFMDLKKDIEVKPVIRFVTSFFRMVLNDFDREDVLSVLKTGLTNNSVEEINIFENYTYVWNINNSKFKLEFKQNPNGFKEHFSEEDEALLETAERVRKSIVEPALRFKKESKEMNGRQISELLYNTMIEMGVTASLDIMYDSFEEKGIKGVGAEQIRIWNLFVDILDKLVAVIGDMELSLKRYFELLSIHISYIQISDVPQTLDSVTVTTAQRVRLSNQKASFLIGCTDGSFPAIPHTSGVFSSFELKILSLNDISISDDFTELSKLETFMTYCCMTSASDKLYITYPVADLLGNAYKPSVIVNEVHKIFNNIIMLDNSDFISPENSMWAIQPAFEEYARSLNSNYTDLSSLAEIFENDSNYSLKTMALKRAVNSNPFKLEKTENAHKLFGNNLKISASQIEKFNLCRFSYFCNYGLRVRERRKAEINPLEYGTLVHYILEKFFGKYSKPEYSTLSDDDIIRFIENILNEYLVRYFGGSEAKSNAFLYRLKVIRDNVFLLLSRLIEELSQSDFDVSACELKIGQDIPAYTIKLPTGENIAVQGSIDRVDIMTADGVSYLRIVDYKTGSKQFKLSDVLYGINLQMLLYLYSVKLNGNSKFSEITPAGVLYMPATTPIISAGHYISEDKIESELDKALKMNGLLLDDIKVIKGMDKSEIGKYIPVKIKVDTPVSDKSLATLEQFGKIFDKIDKTVAEMGKQLYNGNIQAEPLKGSHDACTYCPYDSVCGYNVSGQKTAFDMKNDEVFSILEEENGGEF